MYSILFLRIFVEAHKKIFAIEIANKLTSLIENFVNIENKSVEQYTKIPEYYEIFFKLKPIKDLPYAYQNIIEKLASDWKQINQYESVWDIENKGNFIIQEVRWAHLEGECEQI
jgi:hypothetical protein